MFGKCLRQWLAVVSWPLILCITPIMAWAESEGDSTDEIREHGFGPPPTPNIEIDQLEYQRRLSELEQNQESSDYLYELGYLAYHLGHLEEAEAHFEAAQRHNNYTIPYYSPNRDYWLGAIFEKTGDFEAALWHYTLHSDPYYIHLIRGRIHESKSEVAAAEKEYLLAQAVELFEVHNTEPFLRLAEMYLDLKDYSSALRFATRYLSALEEERASVESMWVEDDTRLREGWSLIERIALGRRTELEN